MPKKYYVRLLGSFFFLACLFLLQPTPAAAQSTSTLYNAGFASGFRYSANPLFTKDTVIRVYFTLQNQSAADIFGTVRIFDNDTVIGDIPFLIVGDRLVELWTDWTVTPGTHALRATIVDAKKSEIGQPGTPIMLSSASSSIDVQTVPPPAPLKPSAEDARDPASTESKSDPNTIIASGVAETSTSSVAGVLSQTVEQLLSLARKSNFSQSGASSTDSNQITSETNHSLSGQFERLISAFTLALEAKKKTIQTEQADGKPGQPILTEQIKALEDKTFIKIPDNKKPTKELVFSWLISLVILILNTWWLMCIIFLIVLRALWKMWKIVRGKTEED